MNVKEIKELVDLVARRGLSGLEIERAGFRIRIEGPVRPMPAALRRGAPAAGDDPSPLAEVATVVAVSGAPAPRPATPLPPASPEPPPEGFHVITSPIVGTFYRAPNPDAPPFVKPGDQVGKGATLCIVEAMKLMNEIESDVSGTVVAVYPQNGQPVEFGEKLFAIQVR